MSTYTTKLTKAQRKEVFSGNPVPAEWMPFGTWHEGADYLCLVLKNSVVPGAYKFVSAGKDLVRAVPVIRIEPSERNDVFKARSDDDGEIDSDLAPPMARMARNLPVIQKTAIPLEQENLRAVCDKLMALLAYADAEAVDIWEGNSGLLSASFPMNFRRIDAAIHSFDFDAALAELSSATERSP